MVAAEESEKGAGLPQSATDEFVLAEAPRGDSARFHSPPRWRHGAPAWVAVAAVLVLVGVLCSPGPQPPDLSGGVPWNILATDLTDEPALTWSTDVTVDHVVGVLGTAVLVETRRSTGNDVGRTITAVDLATGEQRWHVDDPGSTCELSAAALTCISSRGEPDALITLTDADGAVDRSVAYPGALSAVALSDGGLVVVEGGTEALAEVVRLDGFGRERWRRTSSVSGRAGPSWTELEIDGDVVVTSSGSWDLESGQDIEWGVRETAHDGTTRHLVDGTTTVTLTDGTDITVPGEELLLEIDDAFGGPVSLQLAENAGVTATSEEGSLTHVTESDERACHPQARLRGILLQLCLETSGATQLELVALDQLTGEQRWSRTGNSVNQLVASTDTLVLPSNSGVEGVDPITGETRWSVPVAGGPYLGLMVVDGAILVSSSGALTRLD